MKLYVIPVSPNCRQVEAVIHHLDLDVEIINMDMKSGELRQEKFLSLNPNGRVPTFVDGAFNLWESRAIMLHLADMNGDDSFFPKEAAKKSDIVRWCFWEALHYNKAVGAICWETIAKPWMDLGETDESAVEAGLADFHRFAPILNDQLDGKAFIAGDNLTLADFAVGSHAALIKSSRSRIPLDPFPNIKSWYERLDDDPAWDATKPTIEL